VAPIEGPREGIGTEMHSAEHNDLRPFFKAHPIPDHNVVVAADNQVHLMCLSCGFSVTQDAVDAGLPVSFAKAVKT